MTLYPSAANAKKMLLNVAHRMSDLGYFPTNDGNLSCKIGPDAFITIAGGVYKSMAVEDTLVTVGMNGQLLDAVGSFGVPKDADIHIRIFREHPMIFSAINAQSPYGTLCALTGKALTAPMIPDAVTHLGIVPFLPYQKPGSSELADKVSEACKDYTALLLGNRGLFVWGENLYEAWQRFQTAEEFARITWILDDRPDKQTLSKEETAVLVEDRKRYCYYLGGIPGYESDRFDNKEIAISADEGIGR